jgi:hypothetical protein
MVAMEEMSIISALSLLLMQELVVSQLMAAVLALIPSQEVFLWVEEEVLRPDGKVLFPDPEETGEEL